jgi:hypothetical protein
VTCVSDSWLEKVCRSTGPDEAGRQRVDGLNKLEAEQLLDWLDHQSIPDTELTYDPDTGFSVSWRVPPP